ncbi:MAG: ABC transporter permease [Clostridia bacterium]|nr:ABC transporter permease [Clostridia bacterium]
MVYLNALPGAIGQALIWGIMAIGLFISYKILDFADLTVDGSMVTGAGTCAVLIANDVPTGVAILVAFIAGMLCGLVTAFLHTKMGIPPIMSGILTQLALWSVNLKIMGKATISLVGKDLLVARADTGMSIIILVAFVTVVIGILYWFFGTKLGCAIRATGCNEEMARAQGVNTNTTKVLALVLSNGLVALAGALLCQYNGSADINMGRGAIVIGLAAVIIGSVIVSKISSNFAVQLVGAVIGSIVYYLVYQLVICMDWDTDLLKLLSAMLVAVFLAVPHFKQKFNKSKFVIADVNGDNQPNGGETNA